MKKISIALPIFSVIFYLFFYFVLWDAPTEISIAGMFICFLLSIANLAVSAMSLTEEKPENKLPKWLAIVILAVNIPIFLIFVIYFLVALFVPYNFSMMG